jgi:uncharacterized membrane protein
VIRYRLRTLLRDILTSFWFWPLVFIVFACYLALAVPSWGRQLPASGQAWFGDLAAGAQVYAVAILTTTAGADVTILTFVFSTFMVVLQLASSQLSPQILRPTVREGRAQIVMAIMAGGFVFSVCSLLGVYSEKRPLEAVGPALIAILWTIVIVLAFLYFVGYTVSRIRAPAVIRAIAKETARSIRQTYSFDERPRSGLPPRAGSTVQLTSPRDGLITGIGAHDLAAWASRSGMCVELDVGLGDYVSEGMAIGRLRGDVGQLAPGQALRFLAIRDERTLKGDPPYGFRLLVDIACRSLSPAINDPSTAVQALDELQSLLVLLSKRPEQPGRFYDDAGVLAVTMPTMGWSAYLGLAVQEIYEFGRESSQVTQRLALMLERLASVVPANKADIVLELRKKLDVVPPMIPIDATTSAVPSGGLE